MKQAIAYKVYASQQVSLQGGSLPCLLPSSRPMPNLNSMHSKKVMLVFRLEKGEDAHVLI